MKIQNNQIKNTPFSIIDIGSFSIRLVVYDSLSVAARTLFNEKVICNLGKVVAVNSKIEGKELKFMLDVLDRFVSISKSMNSQTPTFLATSAIRISQNRFQIEKIIRDRFDVNLKVLSEESEGKFAALGILYSHKNVTGIVGDLGGGSLELTCVNDDINFLGSLKLGYAFLENIGKPFSYSVNDHIVKSLKKIKNHGYRNFYAVGGSFRVIARLYMFLKKINLKVVQDFSISSQNIKNILKKNLVTKNKKINTDLLLNITKSRRNSLPYALNVLEHMIYFFKVKDVYFSSSSIREGYINSLIKEPNNDAFLFQIQRLADQTITSSMANGLFKWLQDVSRTLNINDDILISACWISNIAWDVHPEHRRMYGMERILWYPFYGISRKERIELAFIMYFRHSNGIKDKSVEEFYNQIDDDKKNLCKFIGQCLRLAHHITGGISTKNLKLCILKLKKNSLKLIVKNKHSIFYGEAIPRGLKNAANAISAESSEIKFV